MLTMYKRKRSTPGRTSEQVRAYLKKHPSTKPAPRFLSEEEMLQRDGYYHDMVSELMCFEPFLGPSMVHDSAFSAFLDMDGDLYLLVVEMSLKLQSAIHNSRNTNENHFRYAIEMMNETKGQSLLQTLKDNKKVFNFYKQNLVNLRHIHSEYKKYASEHGISTERTKIGHPKLF